MKNIDILKVLQSRGATTFYHANSVLTACTFLEAAALLSRGYVEKHKLKQTPQSSDQTDKKYGIWNDIFLDTVDIHDRARRKNHYGPVLLVLDVESVLNDKTLEGTLRITRENPIHWSDGQQPKDRYFETVEEFANSFSFGDFGKHFTFRPESGKVPLAGRLNHILLDDPQDSLGDPNLTESGRVRWLVQIAESTKFKDAAGLGTLAYVASEGDPSVFDGTENDRAIKMLAEGIKRPGDFWNWLIENGRAKGSSWQLQKMRSFVPWATWPWDKAFILTSAFLTSTCAEHEPVRAEADSSDFPYWVAIDKHTDEGKIALREVAKKIGCPYRRLNWVSYYCESALVNSLHDSPWWEREKRWRLGRVGLTPIEAEQLWQSAKVHFCDAVRVHADKLKTEINTIL